MVKYKDLYMETPAAKSEAELGTQTQKPAHENHQRNDKNKTYFVFFFTERKLRNLWLLFESHEIAKIKNVRHISDSCDPLEWKIENAQPWHIARAHFAFFILFITTKNNANASDGPFSPISYLSIAHSTDFATTFSIFHISMRREKNKIGMVFRAFDTA